jgi:hypothetical protein
MMRYLVREYIRHRGISVLINSSVMVLIGQQDRLWSHSAARCTSCCSLCSLHRQGNHSLCRACFVLRGHALFHLHTQPECQILLLKQLIYTHLSFSRAGWQLVSSQRWQTDPSSLHFDDILFMSTPMGKAVATSRTKTHPACG